MVSCRTVDSEYLSNSPIELFVCPEISTLKSTTADQSARGDPPVWGKEKKNRFRILEPVIDLTIALALAKELSSYKEPCLGRSRR